MHLYSLKCFFFNFLKMSHENWLKKFTWYKNLFLWHIESFLCALLKIYTLQQFTLTGRAKRLPKSHVIQQWGDFNLNMRTITLTYISDFSVCLPIKIIAFTWLFFSFKFFSLDNHSHLVECKLDFQDQKTYK